MAAYAGTSQSVGYTNGSNGGVPMANGTTARRRDGLLRMPNIVPLAVGMIIGQRYEIVSVVAHGGMGVIYEAADVHLGKRRCAIKALLDDGMTPADQIEAASWFGREAELLSTLHHPLIPNISDYFSDNSEHYLVMDFVDGQTLEGVLLNEGQPGLPVRKVVEWGRQICTVLQYLHTQPVPVIFRDLKPANIMVTKDRTLKLIDFGIARALDAKRTGQAVHTMIGTPGYCPPEQYQGLADIQSDIYSLGATLHHLISGRNPQNEQPFSFCPLSTLIPTIDPTVESAIAKALSLPASDRFTSAKEFSQALKPNKAVSNRRSQRTAVAPTLPPPSPSVAPPPSPSVAPPPQTTPLPSPGRMVDVSARLLSWPPFCACCCEPATTWFTASHSRTRGKRVKHTDTHSWAIPCCSRCKAHMDAFDLAKGFVFFAMFVSVLSYFVNVLAGQQVALVVGISIALALIVAARSQYKKAQRLKCTTCATIRSPVVYKGWNGSIQYFHFRNGTYANAFIQENNKKIVG